LEEEYSYKIKTLRSSNIGYSGIQMSVPSGVSAELSLYFGMNRSIIGLPLACELDELVYRVRLCSVPFNRSLTGSNLPQVTAWRPWTDCSSINVICKDGNGKPPHSYSRVA